MIAVRALPRWATWVAAGLVLVAAVGVGWRVLAPAEVSTPAKGAPPALVGAQVGVVGTFSAAPLIAHGVRIYAGPRQVRADGPVDQKTQWSPLWSYRRWPAQLVGVAAVGGAVVSQWSDGELVGLAADRGVVRWRAKGPELPEASYEGRRTGAVTVYEPPHLYVAGTTVISAAAAQARGYDVDSGRELWRTTLPSCARRVEFSAGNRFAWACGSTLSMVDAETGGKQPDWSAPGEMTPLGCAGRSDCHGVRAGGKGFVLSPVAPTAAPSLDGAGSWLVTGGSGEEVAVDAQLAARDATTGRQLWQFPGRGEVIAVQRGLVHVLTNAHDFVTLDAVSGGLRSRFPGTAYGQATAWAPGLAAAADGYLTVERLRPGAEPGDPNSAYYFEARPVLLARTI